MAVYARLTKLDAGYACHKELIERCGLVVGSAHEVEHIIMGQSYTTIKLKGCNTYFNSVNFEFEEDGKPLNIYRDARFNPYINMRRFKRGDFDE
jgi:hypothetical protein